MMQRMFAIFYCCLMNLVRDIVDIVALVQRLSKVGMSTPTFPSTANVGPTYPCYLGWNILIILTYYFYAKTLVFCCMVTVKSFPVLAFNVVSQDLHLTISHCNNSPIGVT